MEVIKYIYEQIAECVSDTLTEKLGDLNDKLFDLLINKK